jgi:hypothetical protein
MKKLLLVCAIFMITGCATVVPVTVKFPDAPVELKTKCGDLNKLNEDAKLSDVAKVVVSNYTLYNQCSSKVDAWLDWYNTQKKIFEEIK